MKKIIALTLALLAAGCSTTGGQDLALLRNSDNLRDERRLPMTYVQIQQALFKHQQLCGQAPVFAVNQRNTAEARITQTLSDPPQRNRTVLVDLKWVQGWDGERTVATAYAGFQVSDQEIEQVFKAVLNPETCPAR